MATGKLLFKLPETKQAINVVAFYPDGKTLVSAYFNGSVRLWDTQTGKLIRAWSCGDGKRDTSVFAIAPNGKVLAAVGSEGKIRLWDLKTGKALPAEAKTIGNCNHLALSPDSTLLAEACDKSIQLYRASTLAKVNQFAKREWVYRQTFSQDGKTLFTWGQCRPICSWDVASGKQLRDFSEQSVQANSVALSPDGKTVASPGQIEPGLIEIWDAQTGTVRSASGRGIGRIDKVAFLADGRTIVATMGKGTFDNEHMVAWTNGTGKESRPVPLPLGFWNCLLCSDRSTLAVGTEDGLRLLELPSGREISRLPWVRNWNEDVSIVDVSADMKRAVVGGIKSPVVWDLTTKKVLHRFAPDIRSWGGFSPDGRKLSLQLNGKTGLCVWDLDRKQMAWRCEVEEQPGDQVCRLVYSQDGRMFVTQGSKGIVRLWETATGRERLTLSGIHDWSGTLAFSVNAKIKTRGF